MPDDFGDRALNPGEWRTQAGWIVPLGKLASGEFYDDGFVDGAWQGRFVMDGKTYLSRFIVPPDCSNICEGRQHTDAALVAWLDRMLEERHSRA